MTVTVHLHAAAREAAGASTLSVPATSAGELRAVLSDEHGPPLARVLAVSTLLVDGATIPAGADGDLRPGATVEVLPPFAGG